MGFWDNECCKYCGGHIAARTVDLYRKVEGHSVLIENLPAGVCTACGARFYTTDVLHTLEEMIQGRHTMPYEKTVPAISLLPLHQVLLDKDLQDTEAELST